MIPTRGLETKVGSTCLLLAPGQPSVPVQEAGSRKRDWSRAHLRAPSSVWGLQGAENRRAGERKVGGPQLSRDWVVGAGLRGLEGRAGRARGGRGSEEGSATHPSWRRGGAGGAPGGGPRAGAGRGGGRRCQCEAARGMQRPEAWPRPHPGEGAAAAQAGGPTPPAGAGEPSGLRVRSRRARGAGGGGARRGQPTHDWRRELCATNDQPWGRDPGPGRGGNFRSGPEACPESAGAEWKL